MGVRGASPAPWAVALACAVVVAGCGEGAPDPARTLSIVSGSENRSLEPIVTAFCDDRGWSCPMTYSGSADIRLLLEEGDVAFDAVWPAHSRWVGLGDRDRQVRHLQSIMQSPVVFGVVRSEAVRLGLAGRPVTTRELVDLVRDGTFEFIMTSATQSNSGFAAYMAMLTALAGSPEVLTEPMLDDPDLRADVEDLLSGVSRTSGSSGWLNSLYLEGAPLRAYTAIVTYEALIIEANQTLEDQGLEPLYAIYPADGTAMADSPLGFVARDDNADKEAFFLELQAHLVSAPVQDELLALGRRVGFGGVLEGADPDVFRVEWGIDTTSVIPAIRFPATETIRSALTLYQEFLRKPSLLSMCLDVSGSMDGAGETQLKSAIEWLFDPEVSRRYLLQPSDQDIFFILPFSDVVQDVRIARGPGEAVHIPDYVDGLQAEGGTDIYGCARRALEEMLATPAVESHAPAVILLTDGVSDGDRDAFLQFYRQQGRDIPIYAITFGDADDAQLEEIAAETRARVFNGRRDLTQAFRSARGYN